MKKVLEAVKTSASRQAGPVRLQDHDSGSANPHLGVFLCLQPPLLPGQRYPIFRVLPSQATEFSNAILMWWQKKGTHTGRKHTLGMESAVRACQEEWSVPNLLEWMLLPYEKANISTRAAQELGVSNLNCWKSRICWRNDEILGIRGVVQDKARHVRLKDDSQSTKRRQTMVSFRPLS